MTLAIDVRGLSKKFGDRRVVSDMAIQVETGRITGFVGPNGAGKTTTLRMLCGLLTPDTGEGSVLDLDFRREAPTITRLTGYMTQRFSLYEDMTIAENLTFVARIYGLDNRRRRVEEALEGLGLTARRGQLAGSLSGGWKQRLALAAAMLHEPRLLLLDEPTAGVDPRARREFWNEIHDLAARGVTVLVSTHYMDEAERCHDVCYILGGRVMARGKPPHIIGGSGLITFAGEGEGIEQAARLLAGDEGVISAATFGQTIHVTGTDREALTAAIAPLKRAPFTWREVQPTLEDVFIQLTSSTRAVSA